MSRFGPPPGFYTPMYIWIGVIGGILYLSFLTRAFFDYNRIKKYYNIKSHFTMFLSILFIFPFTIMDGKYWYDYRQKVVDEKRDLLEKFTRRGIESSIELNKKKSKFYGSLAKKGKPTVNRNKKT